MVCIFHNRDLDGFTSAAIVKRWHDSINSEHPDTLMRQGLTLIGYDYSEVFPWDIIPKGVPIVMVDVSLKMSDMLKLALHSNYQLTWIDHHASAIQEYKMFMAARPEFLTAVLKDGIAACEIAWEYFFLNEPMPEAIRLLGMYDTWRNADRKSWNEEILPFQYGMRLYCTSPETFPDWAFTSEEEMIDTVIGEGKIVLQYQAQVNEQQCKIASFESSIGGLRAVCLNTGTFNSNVFASVYDPTVHDIMVAFQCNGKMYKVSFYTTKDDVDCSKLAEQFGGGGHKKAAGCQVYSMGAIFNG